MFEYIQWGKTEPLKAQKINGYFWLVNEFNIDGCHLALLSSYKKTPNDSSVSDIIELSLNSHDPLVLLNEFFKIFRRTNNMGSVYKSLDLRMTSTKNKTNKLLIENKGAFKLILSKAFSLIFDSPYYSHECHIDFKQFFEKYEDGDSVALFNDMPISDWDDFEMGADKIAFKITDRNGSGGNRSYVVIFKNETIATMYMLKYSKKVKAPKRLSAFSDLKSKCSMVV